MYLNDYMQVNENKGKVTPRRPLNAAGVALKQTLENYCISGRLEEHLRCYLFEYLETALEQLGYNLPFQEKQNLAVRLHEYLRDFEIAMLSGVERARQEIEHDFCACFEELISSKCTFRQS